MEDDYDHDDYHRNSNASKPPKSKKKKDKETRTPVVKKDTYKVEPTPAPVSHKPKVDFPMQDQIEDEEPAICFVKAYARKPIGAPSSNLIPLGGQ